MKSMNSNDLDVVVIGGGVRRVATVVLNVVLNVVAGLDVVVVVVAFAVVVELSVGGGMNG